MVLAKWASHWSRSNSERIRSAQSYRDPTRAAMRTISYLRAAGFPNRMMDCCLPPRMGLFPAYQLRFRPVRGLISDQCESTITMEVNHGR